MIALRRGRRSEEPDDRARAGLAPAQRGQVGRGRPVTPDSCARLLAEMAGQVLGEAALADPA